MGTKWTQIGIIKTKYFLRNLGMCSVSATKDNENCYIMQLCGLYFPVRIDY